MAKSRFRNLDRKVTINLENGKPPVRVAAGRSVSTDDEELKAALRKSGFKEQSSSEKEKE